MAYLNQAGTSWPKPAVVREAVSRALEAPPEAWGAEFDAAHRRVAEAFGVRDPGRLLLTPGCTSALALGVADLPWRAGDRVVISAFEHHALHRPVRKLEGLGVEVVVLPGAAGEPVVLDALELELARGDVKLVAATAACNVTGELLPVLEMATLARAHGARMLVDAAQVAGWIPLDFEQLGLDLLAFAGHKGLQAPWGIGGLIIAPEVAMDVPEAVCTLPAAAPRDADEARAPGCSPMPGYCDGGSVDRAALAGLAAALDWLAAPERAERLPRARAGIARLTDEVRGIAGVRLHGPVDPAAKLPTLALTLEGRTPAQLSAALMERGVVAAGGLQCAPLAHATLGTAPDGVLRLSLGPSNDANEVEEAATALRDVLRAP